MKVFSFGFIEVVKFDFRETGPGVYILSKKQPRALTPKMNEAVSAVLEQDSSIIECLGESDTLEEKFRGCLGFLMEAFAYYDQVDLDTVQTNAHAVSKLVSGAVNFIERLGLDKQFGVEITFDESLRRLTVSVRFPGIPENMKNFSQKSILQQLGTSSGGAIEGTIEEATRQYPNLLYKYFSKFIAENWGNSYENRGGVSGDGMGEVTIKFSIVARGNPVELDEPPQLF